MSGRAKRYYLKDGTPVPGATTIVKLLDKSYLIKWANNLGLQGIQYEPYVEETARIGNIIHAIMESHLTKTPVFFDEYKDEEIIQAEAGFYKYLEWEQKHTIEPIFNEKGFVSEKYKFCGIIDFYCILDGKYTVIDFKTSKQINHEQKLQVSSYAPLLQENGYRVDQIMILNIPKVNVVPLSFEVVDLKQATDYFEIFKNLLNIYYTKKQLGWKGTGKNED